MLLGPPGDHRRANILLVVWISLILVVILLMLLEVYLDRRRQRGGRGR